MSPGADPPAPALELEGVSVRYGERIGLESFDLAVAPGEFLALCGPNGSGKTTLMRAALGFLSPERGRVRLFGHAVSELSIRERAHRVAWVPQEEPLREDVPLGEYVLYGRYAFHGPLDGPTEEERAQVEGLLSDVGLADRAHDGVLSLSGGERQRAILARALAQATPLLLLDAPTAHLDIGHQLDLLDRVRALARTRRVTVVAALHDLNLAARFADRLVVLSRGRRVADGPPSEVLSEELLARVWGVSADLARDARTGVPYLVPHLLAPSPPRVDSPFAGPIHVVGGGGAAAPILRRLTDAGYRVTTGALHLLDTDEEVAEALGLPSAIESPFAPLGAAARAQHERLLAAARVIVVAPFAVGPANLANLEDLRAHVGKTPTYLLRTPPLAARDFTEGRATRVYAELLGGGAREVDDLPALLAAIRAELERSGAGPGSATGPTG